MSSPTASAAPVSTVGRRPDLVFRRGSAAVLAVIVLAYFLFRLPILLCEPARLDEHYAVPGWTILRTGLPQLPHLPSRNPESMFYRADEVLYAEPPLHFYAEALSFLVFPDTIGTARLPSLCAGAVILVLISVLTWCWTGDRLAGLCAAALFSLSRWFIYGVTLARGDILCTMFGLAALWTVCRWRIDPRLRWLVAAGVLIGLGGLTHPFALVYAFQIGIWVVAASRGWQRARNFAVVTTVSLLVFALWIPLILVDPELFRIQFENQFLGGGGETLGWMKRPWNSLWYHEDYLWKNIGPWQFLLGIVPLTIATGVGLWRQEAGLRASCALAWSSLVLMSLLSGTHHDVPGYWSYPGSLIFVSVGWLIATLAEAAMRARRGIAVWLLPAGGLALLAAMIPGSSARLLQAAVWHWNDDNYCAPAFARKLLAEIPVDARCTVDGEFVLDFLAAGRPVLGIPTEPIYFDAEHHPYDYLVVSRYSMQYHIGQAYCGQLLRTAGIQEDPFACYVEIYTPSTSPCRPQARIRPEQ